MIVQQYAFFRANYKNINWNYDIKIALISNGYAFNYVHSLNNISEFIVSTSELQNKQIIYSDSTIFDADDIILQSDKSKEINSLLVYDEINGPWFLIKDISGLPVFAENIIINFSNNYSKIFSVKNSEVTFGNIIVGSYSKEIPTEPVIDYSRSNISLDRDLETDKNRLSPKANIYKDVSLLFKPHPLTGDLTSVAGLSSINQSIKIILMTNLYERPYTSYDVSANIHQYLFDVNDNITLSQIRDEIAVHLANHEPRITILNIEVDNSVETYQVFVRITYMIKTNNKTEEFSILLDRV